MTEDLVREVLRADADAVPTDVDLLGGVTALRGERRRRGALAGGTAVAVVLIAGAVAVPVSLRHHALAPTRNGPITSSAAVTYPPGTRPVTWAGIQLDVPATWTDATSDPHRCAEQDAKPGGEVDYAGAVTFAEYACKDAAHPIRQRLELGTSYSLDVGEPGPGSLSGVPTTFAGVGAVRVQSVVHGQLVTEYTVRSTHAVFTLTTNTAAEAAAIADTARAVTVDQNGCAVVQPRDFPTVGAGGDGAVLAAQPTGGIACAYVAGRLQSGTSLDAGAITALTGALEGLPTSYTSAQLQAQRTEPEVAPATTVQLTLRDAAGRQQLVTAEFSKESVGVAGRHTATLTQELAGDLETVLPSGFLQSYSDDVIPPGCLSCTLTTAPPPTRPVTFRGITLNVPATWTDIGSSPCLQPGGYVETITSPPPTGVYNCPAVHSGAYRELILSDARYGGLRLTTPVTRTDLAGMAAMAQRGTVPNTDFSAGEYAVSLHLPATQTDISVVAPTEAEVDAILATARPAGT
jgi:hypothetical protein